MELDSYPVLPAKFAHCACFIDGNNESNER